ncbi:hypothetical protein GALL_47090 [mine drainage metagenome]|uniref:Uncharacterized protein n=1 Tax=mine drainage metagenome TaxID=410659 RepID=A0A1J5T077_9ZZZZ
MGLFPNFKKSFIGVRWNYAEYNTHLLNDPTQFSHNFYNTTEIWGGFNIGNRFQVLAFLPYHYNVQFDDDKGHASKNGMGDITVLANYKLFDTRYLKNQTNKTSQQVWIGGGIKLPTGAFNVDVHDSATTLADINSQIGTGSVDLFLNARHTIQFNNFGINTSVNYKIGLANNQNYKYGNKLSFNSIASYRISNRNLIITPNAGLSFENIESNQLNGQKIYLSDGLNSGTFATGGHVLSALAGVEVTIKEVTIGANIQAPLTQDFAAGQTKLNVRGMLHISFAL